MRLNFQGIKCRLIMLGVAICLLSVLMRLFIALPRFQEHVGELVASQQLSLASYIASDVDYSISARLSLIGRFAADVPAALVHDPVRLDAWLQDRQRANLLFNGGLRTLAPTGADLGPVMGKPQALAPSGEPAIVFTAPVHDAAGKVALLLGGVAYLNRPGFLDRLTERRNHQISGFLLISPNDKLFVAASDPAMILRPTPAPGRDLLHDRAMAGYRGTGLTINASGAEELSAIVTVPSTGWFVVARIPAEQAFRPVERVRAFMLQASVASLAALLLILLFGVSRILRPLVEAARAIRAMANSKSELVTLPVERDDEVGKLVSGFNILVQRLHKEEAARHASEARLAYMAHHDSLTGLYNRAMLENRLEQELARAERNDSQIALLFCDLDGFKAINDDYGHHAGDAVLCEVAARLSAVRRKVDTVARLGGDEFVILLSDVQDAHATATHAAQQCLDAMRVPFVIDGSLVTLGLSIGIAQHGGMVVPASHMLSQADTAMYQVKRKGKGTFFFIEDMTGDDDELPAPAGAAVRDSATVV